MPFMLGYYVSRLLNYFYLISISVSLALLLTACPNALVYEIDKRLDSANSNSAKRTIMRTGKISVTDFRNKYNNADTINSYPQNQFKAPVGSSDSISAEANDSSLSSINSPMPPLKMEILSVDDKNYPEEIIVRAHVYDNKGNFVTGLAEPYFKGPGTVSDYWLALKDSSYCGSHSIASFKIREVRQDDSPPYALVYVLDHSGSMGYERIHALQKVIRKMLHVTKPSDQISAWGLLFR